MGYNKTPGGDSKLGKSYSKEDRLKLSLARKGKPKTVKGFTFTDIK